MIELSRCKDRAADRHTKRPPKHDHIIAVDGEGITDVEGEAQRYNLLAASNGTAVRSHDLSTIECFEFLLGLPKTALVVGFSINYDVSMWLKDLDLESLRRLWKLGSVSWKGYRITYHPGKIFSIGYRRRRIPYQRHDCSIAYKIQYERHTTVWDTFGFYQTSFVNALDLWKIGTEEQRAFIRRMKEQRSFFDDTDAKQVEAYCFAEVNCMVEMMDKLIATSERCGLRLTRYDGAGAIAAAMMRKHHVKEFIADPPPEVFSAALHGYFGGRFENSIIGTIKKAWIYDINSAYPAQLAKLPCLRCGHWELQSEAINNDQVAIYRVRWNLESQLPIFGPFPYRTTDGAIIYPMSGEGWYWSAEVDAAKRLYPIGIEIIEGWKYKTLCGHAPFSFVTNYYAQRVQMKDDFGQIILKLGLNSLYGKCAQSVGGKIIGKTDDGTLIHARPAFQSFVWAGLITSGTRAKILDTLGNGSVVSIATDGVICDKPLGMIDSTELGEWKSKTVTQCSLMQNGVYRYYNGDKWINRARGFSDRQFDWPAMLAAFDSDGARAVCEGSNVVRFLGLGAALHRAPPLKGWRIWYQMRKRVSLKPQNRILYTDIGIDIPRRTPPRVIPTLAWHGMLGGPISFPYVPKTVFAHISHPDREQDLIDVDS